MISFRLCSHCTMSPMLLKCSDAYLVNVIQLTLPDAFNFF